MTGKERCGWALSDELMCDYHDAEWGVPVHDDNKHYEFLVLEGAQAGLSWATILKRREGYRHCFAGCDPAVGAQYDESKVAELLSDPSIIRNKLKVNSAVKNARAFLAVQKEFGSFDAYIWPFVGGKPKINGWRSMDQIPATSAESDALSKDLKARGFSFAGSTIIYAHLQATGLVNDHLTGCFRFEAVQRLGAG